MHEKGEIGPKNANFGQKMPIPAKIWIHAFFISGYGS